MRLSCMKEVGKTIGERGELIPCFECEKCKIRTIYPEKHKCEVEDGRK